MSGLLDVENGLDTVVVAGTGSGKSVLFQSIPIAVKDGIVLVISPTLALMADQICAYYHLKGEKLTLNKLEQLASLNIPAVALTADYIQQNPRVWSRLEKGAYSVVLASPEILLVHGSVFLLRVVRNRTCAFIKRLACIAIDEAHLV